MIEVFPAIDLIDGRCVRLEQGDYNRKLDFDDDPVRKAGDFLSSGAARLHLVDLDGAREGRGINRRIIGAIADRSPVPVQVGGGIRSESDVRELIGLGADFLILGTIALQDPERVTGWVRRWGEKRFILSLDCQNGELKTSGWLQTSELSIVEAARWAARWELSQVICTDIECDGSLKSPGLTTLRRLRALLDPRVCLIAAGGVSQPRHLLDLEEIGVGAAIVGRALYDGEFQLEAFLNVG